MTGSFDIPFALVLAIPICPEKADGRALEGRKKHKRNSKYTVYDNSCPQQSPGRSWEDLKIEEQKRHLQKHNLGEI